MDWISERLKEWVFLVLGERYIGRFQSMLAGKMIRLVLGNARMFERHLCNGIESPEISF